MLAVVGACLALLAPAAAEANYKDVIKDCAQDGKLDKKYSQADLKKAKQHLPADLNEYSDCRDVIGAAIGGAGKRGGGASGGSGPPNPGAAAAGQQALSKLTAPGAKPRVRIGGRLISPDKSGLFRPASARNDLPLPLALALIVMTIVALGGGAYALRKRIPALAKIPLPRISLPRGVSLSRLRR